ncbi:MAG: PQQ-binding-like beta-propeller repeat protein [bacterium]
MNVRRGALLVMALLLLPLLSSCIRVFNPVGWAPVAFDGDSVYVTTSKGHLSSIKITDDTANATWTFPDKSRSEDKSLDLKAIYGAPVIDGDRIYIASFHAGVFALRKEDGRPIWPASGTNASKLRGDIPGGVAISGDNLYFGTTEGRIYGWKKSDGSPAVGWEKPKVVKGGVWATPVIMGDTMYVATMEGDLHAFSLQDGTEKWKFSASGAIADLTRINDDYLFVPSINRHVYMIRTKDGSVAGDFKAADWIWTAPAVQGTQVFFGDFGGKVYGLDITSGSIVPLWSQPASLNNERVKAGAAIINDVVVVADRKPVVTFINAKDGSVLNAVPLTDVDTVRADVVAKDGEAYVITTDGKLFRADPEQKRVIPIPITGAKK